MLAIWLLKKLAIHFDHKNACIGYEATCILWLGDIALAESKRVDAYSRYEEALQLYRQVNDVLGEERAIARQKLAKQFAKRRSGRPK
jgi:hypothetical protein